MNFANSKSGLGRTALTAVLSSAATCAVMAMAVQHRPSHAGYAPVMAASVGGAPPTVPADASLPRAADVFASAPPGSDEPCPSF